MSFEGRLEDLPPFKHHAGQTSYFGDDPPLPESVGWLVVIGFGLLFSVITTLLVMADKFFAGNASITSEHFK